MDPVEVAIVVALLVAMVIARIFVAIHFDSVNLMWVKSVIRSRLIIQRLTFRYATGSLCPGVVANQVSDMLPTPNPAASDMITDHTRNFTIPFAVAFASVSF